MMDKLQRIVQQLRLTLGPFIALGIAIAFIIGLFILSWYILTLGLFIGVGLWLCGLIRRSFFHKKASKNNHQGRIIDHDKNQ